MAGPKLGVSVSLNWNRWLKAKSAHNQPSKFKNKWHCANKKIHLDKFPLYDGDWYTVAGNISTVSLTEFTLQGPWASGQCQWAWLMFNFQSCNLLHRLSQWAWLIFNFQSCNLLHRRLMFNLQSFNLSICCTVVCLFAKTLGGSARERERPWLFKGFADGSAAAHLQSGQTLRNFKERGEGCYGATDGRLQHQSRNLESHHEEVSSRVISISGRHKSKLQKLVYHSSQVEPPRHNQSEKAKYGSQAVL